MPDEPPKVRRPPPAFYEILMRHFFEKFGGKIPACPMCGNNREERWSIEYPVAPMVYDPEQPDKQSKVLNLNAVMPLVVMMCRDCFYVAHFAWRPILEQVTRGPK